MKIAHNQLSRTAGALLIGALTLLALPAYALADASASPTAVSNDVTAAVASQGEPSPTLLKSAGRVYASGQGTTSIAIPSDGSRPATLKSMDGAVRLTLPTDGQGARVGSTVVYDGLDGSNLALQSVTGGLRAIVDIHNASASHTYRFELGGDVHRIVQDTNGSAELLDSSGDVVGSIDRPWAVDANGMPVPTHYVVDGTTVTQVVEFDAGTVFPVTADPAVHLHWTTYTVELWPTDQRAILAGASAAIVDLVCTKVPGLTAACMKAAKPFQAALTVYVAKNFHPRCHLNLSFYYGPAFPPSLNRIWTSQCN